MKSLSLVYLFFCLSVGLVFAGCGRDLKLSVKAAENEKDQPAAALVRKVELTYHDPRGNEEVRESFAVLGLAQPVSAHSDLVKELRPQEGGHFEARGYSADGLLLLRGEAPAREDSDTIEVVLSRQKSQESLLDSPVVRRIRMADVPGVSDYQLDAKQVREKLIQRQCQTLPPLRIQRAAGKFPKLIIEGAVKAPTIRLMAKLMVAGGEVKAWIDWKTMKINPAGEAELELGRDFMDGVLLKSPSKVRFDLWSSHEEGCLEVETRPETRPVAIEFQRFDEAIGKELHRWSIPAIGGIAIRNPNDMPVSISIVGVVTEASSGKVTRPLWAIGQDQKNMDELRADSDQIQHTIEVSAGGMVSLGLYGAVVGGKLASSGVKVSWTVKSNVTFDSPESASTLQETRSFP